LAEHCPSFGDQHAKPPGDHIALGGFVQTGKVCKGPHEPLEPMKSFAGAECWHLWTIVLPRRSITGRLVWGRVWRRHDRGRWIYKRFVRPSPGRRTLKSRPRSKRLNDLAMAYRELQTLRSKVTKAAGAQKSVRKDGTFVRVRPAVPCKRSKG
jgi:hypothetical protein